MFEVQVRRDRVVAYLADPGNAILANRPRRIVEQSSGPITTGSWAVLAMDQLRVRVEYVAFEPPGLVVIQVTTSGLMAMGTRSTQRYELQSIDGGRRTRVGLTSDGSGGCLPSPLVRLVEPLQRRSIRKRMNRIGDGPDGA
ncbi:MAG: hypothetical protein QOH61_61 [Chloroflexota bacterium]|nr:hypothetical protein [Chloroflexota bacterium]